MRSGVMILIVLFSIGILADGAVKAKAKAKIAVSSAKTVKKVKALPSPSASPVAVK